MTGEFFNPTHQQFYQPVNQTIWQVFISQYSLYKRDKKVYVTVIDKLILQSDKKFYAYQYVGNQFMMSITDNVAVDETDLMFTYDSHTPFFSKKISEFDCFDNMPCYLTQIEVVNHDELCLTANGYDNVLVKAKPHDRQANEHFSDKRLVVSK